MQCWGSLKSRPTLRETHHDEKVGRSQAFNDTPAVIRLRCEPIAKFKDRTVSLCLIQGRGCVETFASLAFLMVVLVALCISSGRLGHQHQAMQL